MKRIYLIRHAEPELNGERHMCVGGRSDPPLSAEGLRTAEILASEFSDVRSVAVFSSPLKRAQQTACILSGGKWSLQTLPGLAEQDCGAWDGIGFERIRREYPVEYALRGENPDMAPPGGETLTSCANRAMTELEKLRDVDEENVIVVAHAGVNRAILCRLMGLPFTECRGIKQAYGCINCIVYENGRLRPSAVGVTRNEMPDVESIYRKYDVPENVREHCRAVNEIAMELSRKLVGPYKPDAELLKTAALLHDIFRTQPKHAAAAEQLMMELGYPRLASVIKAHHDCSTEGVLDEKKLLFLADKMCMGTERISIGRRFGESRSRCRNEEALSMHAQRWTNALNIEKQYYRAVEKAEETIR